MTFCWRNSILILAVLLAACNAKKEAPPAQNIAEKKQEHRVEKPTSPFPSIRDEREYLMKYGAENPGTKVKIKTRLGDFTVKLYEDVPLHRANFIHHAKNGLYDKAIFYRVVPDFMVQGGNSDDPGLQDKRAFLDPYYVPSERRPEHFHKRGAIAMAMTYQDNPEEKSAQYSFYIVTAGPMSEAELNATEKEYEIEVPDWKRKTYLTLGGTPHLDARHTVFGEVVDGMDVVDSIANVETDSGDWPVTDITMTMEVLE